MPLWQFRGARGSTIGACRLAPALWREFDRRLPRHEVSVAALRESGQHSAHGSAIVNLASVAGLVGSSNDPFYSMTKGGVTLFTKSAALEFARKGYRIRVNSIHRGTIDTDRSDQVLAMRARNLGTNDLEPAPQADAEPASRSAAWGR